MGQILEEVLSLIYLAMEVLMGRLDHQEEEGILTGILWVVAV
jgi:hypothetical protein